MADTQKSMVELWQEFQEKMIEAWKDSMPREAPYNAMSSDYSRQMMEKWQEMQQKMVEYWKGEDTRPFDIWESMANIPGWDGSDQGDKMQEFYKDMMQTTSRNLEELWKMAPPGVGKETYGRMKEAGEVYSELMAFWMETAVKLPDSGDVEKWQEFLQNWFDNYNRVLDSFFRLGLPEPVKELVKGPGELTHLQQEVLFNFMQPWFQVAPEMKDKLVQAMRGDREAYKDFVRLFHKTHEDTYGRTLRVPAFGLSREHLEQLLSSIDSYTRYVYNINELNAVLYRQGYEAMEDLMNKVTRLAEEGKAPTTFREFYKLWWQSNEEAFYEIFSTEEFGRLLGEVVNSWAGFKIDYDNLMSRFINENLPIPTKGDMESVYKTIHEVRNNVKARDEQVENLNGQLEEMESQLSKREKEVKDLNKTVKTLSETVEKMNKKIEDLEAQVKANKGGESS